MESQLEGTRQASETNYERSRISTAGEETFAESKGLDNEGLEISHVLLGDHFEIQSGSHNWTFEEVQFPAFRGNYVSDCSFSLRAGKE